VVVVTQLWLVASGNFAWLNWLTLVLACAAFSDAQLQAVLPLAAPVPAVPAPPAWYLGVVLAGGVLVAVLSYWPVRNLASRRQVMNANFNPFHLVNAYGAFGSITRRREEVVIEATLDEPGPGARWEAYEFRGKPTDPHRRPRQVAPYHLRLDWLAWFVPLAPAYGQLLLPPLLGRLLAADRATLRLLRRAPFGERPPRAVRVRLFRYRFTTWAERRATGEWWHREEVELLVPPVSRGDLPVPTPR
jgi:hypothetical protein